MKQAPVWCLAMLVLTARAETAYVSDELILGVYAEQDQKGARLSTLHSGATVEIVGRAGEFTQVKLADGITGWVKTSFLVAREPAALRVKKLEEELSRSHATTPALAEAAARSELEHLKQDLNTKQGELDAMKATARNARVVTPNGDDQHGDAIGISTLVGLVCLGVGFAIGYATLARRIKQKFGGIKVY